MCDPYGYLNAAERWGRPQLTGGKKSSFFVDEALGGLKFSEDFSTSIIVNHHFSPPFGIIFLVG